MNTESNIHALAGTIYRTVIEAKRLFWDSGYMRSRLSMMAVDNNGDPLPWFTYPAIEWLARQPLADMSVFEFGAGQSTLWLAGRCKCVMSVESDSDWYDYVFRRLSKLAGNASLVYEPDKTFYRQSVYACKRPNLAIIDGIERDGCAFECIAAGVPMVLLDNAEYCTDAATRLANAYRHCIPFVGISPGYKTNETTLFMEQR